MLHRGVATGGRGQGGHISTSISEPSKVQQLQFETSGILLYTGEQKLSEPKVS